MLQRQSGYQINHFLRFPLGQRADGLSDGRDGCGLHGRQVEHGAK